MSEHDACAFWICDQDETRKNPVSNESHVNMQLLISQNTV